MYIENQTKSKVGADLCVCPEGEHTMGEHTGSLLRHVCRDECVMGEHNL
jgi:hypothetical protein